MVFFVVLSPSSWRQRFHHFIPTVIIGKYEREREREKEREREREKERERERERRKMKGEQFA